MQSNERKLQIMGQRSKGIVLPAKELKDLGWRTGQRLIVKRAPRGFIILDALTKKKKK